jgi:hypothetical protein
MQAKERAVDAGKEVQTREVETDLADKVHTEGRVERIVRLDVVKPELCLGD